MNNIETIRNNFRTTPAPAVAPAAPAPSTKPVIVIMPADILSSLNRCATKYKGKPVSTKQHRFFIQVLKQYATATKQHQGANTYFIAGEEAGQRYAFVTRPISGKGAIVRYMMTPGHADRQRWRTDLKMPFGPTFSADAVAELRRIIGWGPSRSEFQVNNEAVIAGLVKHAKLAESVARAKQVRVGSVWGSAVLTVITRIQIAAKGLLCEVGDNAGTSPVAMSADDANYVSRMLVNGHIRNAHYFQMKATGYKGIRGACVVNKAKMDDGTAALAQRMVDLMNAAVQQLGRPVSFAEYKAMAGNGE